MAYVMIAAGAYLSAGAFVLDTENLRSAIFLRAVPGLIGIGLIISGAARVGLI